MKYIPKKTALARRLAFVNLLCGIIFFAVGSATEMQWIGQCIGLIAIVAGVQFLIRFVMTDYTYIIEDSEDGDVCLIVYKKTGGKEIKLCHISLYYVTNVCERVKKNEKADKVYNYCQNFGARAVSVMYEDSDKLCEIIIEADKAFTDAINERIGKGSGETNFAM